MACRNCEEQHKNGQRSAPKMLLSPHGAHAVQHDARSIAEGPLTKGAVSVLGSDALPSAGRLAVEPDSVVGEHDGTVWPHVGTRRIQPKTDHFAVNAVSSDLVAARTPAKNLGRGHVASGQWLPLDLSNPPQDITRTLDVTKAALLGVLPDKVPINRTILANTLEHAVQLVENVTEVSSLSLHSLQSLEALLGGLSEADVSILQPTAADRSWLDAATAGDQLTSLQGMVTLLERSLLSGSVASIGDLTFLDQGEPHYVPAEVGCKWRDTELQKFKLCVNAGCRGMVFMSILGFGVEGLRCLPVRMPMDPRKPATHLFCKCIKRVMKQRDMHWYEWLLLISVVLLILVYLIPPPWKKKVAEKIVKVAQVLRNIPVGETVTWGRIQGALGL